MADQLDAIQRIETSGLVAVVRAESEEQALRIAEACRIGGVDAIEITFTVPGAARVIEALTRSFPAGEVLVGAGTVLDPETARVAILAGARFVVGPGLSPSAAALCSRYGVDYIPGAMTVTEILAALEHGARIIKAFPGEVLGPAFVRAVLGPIPHARLMPTGGVSVANAGDWIRAGAVALGVGGLLTSGARTGDYAAVTTAARALVAAVRGARERSSD